MATNKQEDVRSFLGSAHEAIRSLAKRAIKSRDIRRDLDANDLLPARKVSEDGTQLMHLNYLVAFDGIIASRGGIPLIDQGAIIGAIGGSGGTDSQDEVVSKAGAAVINKPRRGSNDRDLKKV